MTTTRRARLAVLGIGNTLAGDDSVGVVVARRLERKWRDADGVLFGILPGDLLAVSDWLDRAERFLFLDAVAGDRPGRLVRVAVVPRAFAPSLHQTDIGSVMEALRGLEMTDPFPDWEVWGIEIAPPQHLTESLSPEVAHGAEALFEAAYREIQAVTSDAEE